MPRDPAPDVSAAAALFLALAATVALAADDPRPWPPQYKLRPGQAERLTPADVVGPDGIVYPNWTRCGVQGGIPAIEAKAAIGDFGGKPDDGADDAEALHRACEAVGRRSGGAVTLAKGVYHLDRPVTVRRDGVVIRGQGRDATHLVFRYAIPDAGVAFFWPPAGSRVGPATRLEMHCAPTGLTKMTMKADDAVIGSWARSTHSGNTFVFARSGRHVVGKLPDGARTLEGIAEYRGGKTRSARIPIVLDKGYDDARPVPCSQAAITFDGRGRVGKPLRLARDGKRGDVTVELASVEGLAPGDWLFLEAPATDRWKTLVRCACRWGSYRRYMAAAEGIQGKTVTLSQPLRIDFPTVDGSYVQKIQPIRRCGIEALTIEQTENLWITSVLFRHGVECWGRDVLVRKCGRFPIYGSMAKWCEIRGCVFDDAWFKGGGGTAYAGWQGSWDCLIDGIETFKLRHAPLFQWAASGNVIRRGVFHLSDGQWHAGWTHENLIEQCVIVSERGHGGYGYGMWASPPQDRAHGPNGPRNVVYNCDVSSPRAGLWMGGMNEAWLILHNRFVVERDAGVYAGRTSFDHILQGNVFILKDSRQPMVRLAAADCVGIELIGNRLYGGNGRLVEGKATPAVLRDNQALPLADAPRPTPRIPSIYEWQQRRRKAPATPDPGR